MIKYGQKEFEVGTHRGRIGFDCKECAERYYNDLSGKKYFMNRQKNELIHNTYGWKNVRGL